MTDPSDIDACLLCRGNGWRYVTYRSSLLHYGFSGEVGRTRTRRPCRACGGTGVRSSSTGTGTGAEPRAELVTSGEEGSARLGAVQQMPAGVGDAASAG